MSINSLNSLNDLAERLRSVINRNHDTLLEEDITCLGEVLAEIEREIAKGTLSGLERKKFYLRCAIKLIEFLEPFID